MAPDRRKKRLNSSSSASQEKQKQCAAKRKKFQDSGMASLADILNVPHASVELKDLMDVLSYEVWHSHISDADRNILTQYLPRGADPDKLVQELLSGDNFHFGNPFLKWGASLCSGKLQPDDVLHQEQYIKAKKKMYLSELQKYHDDMIESLLRWKDTLDICKDSQEETLHNIWKSRKQSGKKKDLCEMLYINEDGDITTPESSSQATSDKSCCLHIPGDYHRRNVLSDSNANETSDGLKVAVKPETEEKLQKRNVQLCDGAKNMSYIKRFEVFEEEERQKLRDYWFQLVTRDFPAFYVSWRERKLKAQELVKSVCQDLEQKLKLQEKFLEQDDENDSSHNVSPAELANNVSPAELSLSAGAREDEKMEVSHTLIVGQMANQVGSGENALPMENERQRYDGEEDVGQLARISFREHVSGIHDGGNSMMAVELAGNMNHMNDVWSAVTYGGEFSQAAEMIDLEAGGASGREVCFHKNEGFNLPKRMGLDFEEAMAMGVPALREKESNTEEWGGCLPDCWGHQSWNSGLDQTLFSVLSGCDAFSAPTPAPPPPTATSIPVMDGSEQSSGVSLEWMGVSPGFLRSWNQY